MKGVEKCGYFEPENETFKEQRTIAEKIIPRMYTNNV